MFANAWWKGPGVYSFQILFSQSHNTWSLKFGQINDIWTHQIRSTIAEILFCGCLSENRTNLSICTFLVFCSISVADCHCVIETSFTAFYSVISLFFYFMYSHKNKGGNSYLLLILRHTFSKKIQNMNKCLSCKTQSKSWPWLAIHTFSQKAAFYWILFH